MKKTLLLLLMSCWAGAAFSANLLATPPDYGSVPAGIPRVLRAQGEEPKRLMTDAFTARIGGHDVVVTLHDADREAAGTPHAALSTWRRVNGAFRLIARLELERACSSEIREFQVKGQE